MDGSAYISVIASIGALNLLFSSKTGISASSGGSVTETATVNFFSSFATSLSTFFSAT